MGYHRGIVSHGVAVLRAQSTMGREDDPDPNRDRNGDRDPFEPHLISRSFATTVREAEENHRLDLVKVPPECLDTPYDSE
eukprot:6735984-Prorocentrum_lima.AAC.1